jgi:uncharacterized protein (DUF433 family)
MENQILSNGKIAGTRISVYDVYYYLVNDWQPKEIGPILQLSKEQVQSAIHYIEANRAAVVAVHNEIEERNARGNPPEVEAKLVITRAKMQAWLKERHRQDKSSSIISF